MTTVSSPFPTFAQSQYLIWYPGLSFSTELGSGGFTDPQNLAMTYSASLADGSSLPSWLSFDAATGTLSGTVPSSYQQQNSTTLDLTVTATDSAGLSAFESYFLEIYKVLPPSESNFIPTVHVLPGQSFTSRMPVDAFSDPQGLPMTYSASAANGGVLPSWLSFDPATLTFSGTAPSNEAGYNYAAQFHATDSAGQTGTVWFTIYFTAGPPNLSEPTADQSWTVGQAVNFTLPTGTFTDPEGEAMTYSVTGANGQQLPSWLLFNAKTMTFSGTPPAGSAGLSLGIEVTATDTAKQSSSETFNVVLAAQPAPELSAPTADQTWSLDQPVSLTLPAGTFIDLSGLALTYTAKSADGSPLPSWLKFDPSTLTFSGTTPGVSATLSLEVDATNYAGATTGEVFKVTVGQPNPNASPPSLTNPTVAQNGWAAGQTVSLTLAANTFTDPQHLALTYTATQADGTPLPSWLTFDPATLTFSGTVPASGAELGIEVTATNSAGVSASETFAALANQGSGSGTVQLVSAIPDSTWKIGQAITIAVPAGAFTDPQGLALTYSATSTDGSALPSWLKVDPATGTITGTAPPTGESLSIRLTATDSANYTGHDDFRLNVPAPYAPELKDSTHDQSWTVGQSVTLALPADSFQDPQGEALTYSATLSNGAALPSWLHFDAASGTFSGVVPSTATSLTVTVTATDLSELTGSETFGIAISGTAASGGTTVSDSAANVGAHLDQLQAEASAGSLKSITLTDSGTPTLALSTVQVISDAQALAVISGSFSVTQTVTGTNLTITGVVNALGNTVVFSGDASQYTITPAGDGMHLSVSTGGSTDRLSGIQALQFGDVTDILAQAPGNGSTVTSGNVTELYGAIFGREPDVAGLGFYQAYSAANPGTPLLQFAEWFLSSSEYTAAHTYAPTTAGDTLFIEDSYQNLLHRTPTQAEVDFYLTNVLDGPGSKLQTHAQMLVYFSASTEFLGNVQVTAQTPSSASHWLILI